ncbi:MAG: fused MFS/spermidine synthase [Bacteroidales bacterium]|nr:fused MFS/spermidine synthase [Bacteroidales bacterium]
MFGQKKDSIKFSVFILGFSAFITQIILLREFLTVLYGNELVIGVVLSNWMILTATGAFLGKYFKRFSGKKMLIIVSQLLLAFLPMVTTYSIYYLKSSFILPGQMVGLYETIFGSLLILTPFCLLSGFLFIVFCVQLAGLKYSNIIGKTYAIEAFGSVVGGLVFNFILLFLFKTFVNLKIIMLLNLIAATILVFNYKKNLAGFSVLGAGFLMAVFFLIKNFDSAVIQLQYQDKEVLVSENTPYGNLVITKTDNQFNFYENGIPYFSTEDKINVEESVHYAMLQHSDPKNILVVSGGYSGIPAEINKYQVSAIDYVELNPAVINAALQFTSNLSMIPQLNVINRDGRQYIRQTDKKYDVVLLNIPDPVTVELNRYYTVEFFEELKKKMNEYGVVSTYLLNSNNYLTEEAVKTHATLFSTLQLIFQHVILIPGERNYFIASDGQLKRTIVELLELKNLENSYVNEYYLNDELIISRSDFIMNDIRDQVRINYDFQPVSQFLQLKYWLNKIKFINSWPLIFLLLPFIIFIFRANKINLGLFSTGFTATSLEIILIIAFQIIYGNVYQMIGMIITIFMIGLATGANYNFFKIRVDIKIYSLIQYVIGIFSILVSIVLYLVNPKLGSIILIYPIFAVLLFVSGTLTGMQYSFATQLLNQGFLLNASKSYASDLFGSALGALAVAAFLIPALGILKVCLILGIVNFIVGLSILLRK